MENIDSRKEACKKLLDELNKSSSEKELDSVKMKMKHYADQIENHNKDIAHTLVPTNPLSPSASIHEKKDLLKNDILNTIQKLDDLANSSTSG